MQTTWQKIIGKICLAGTIMLGAIIIFANARILSYNNFFNSAENVPTNTLAIVFGGGMKDDGTQSDFQADRVARGAELYKEGKANKLLMTGDDGGNHDDEVAAMKLQAIQLGVPKDDIIMDPHGYRTYESCYRARYVYSLTSAIVVSQAFHIPRILYLCRGMGIDAVGVSPDLQNYGWPGIRIELREVLARVKAWWQLEVARPSLGSLAQ